MKAKLICVMALACAVFQLAAMPTEEETKRAEPVVKKLLAPERAALKSGKKTRSEVAAAAMKLADEADTDAAKLLLMKGAFVLYVKDGNLEKATETMKALESAISDMPPQSVTNMIEIALLGVSKKENSARLYKLLDEAKAGIPSHIEPKLAASSVKERSSVASILKAETDSSETARVATAKDMTGPYGIRMQPDPGCEKGAGYVLERLVKDYLPAAVRYYGDPFGGKSPSRVYTIVVKRNDGSDGRGHTGPSWGGRGDGISQFTIGLAKGSDKWDMDLTLVANRILTVCDDDVGFHLYVNDFIRGDVKGVDPVPEVKEMIRRGLAKDGDAKTDRRLGVWRKYAPMWAAFEELRERHPTFILDYCKLKNSRYAEGKLPQRLSFDQMADLLGEVTGENMVELFKKYGVGRRGSQKYPLPKISVAQTLQGCDFLLNKDFKKNAKYYLCLFSASWCGPCRAEMPRIAKTYAESLKDDPNIELIHFSRDQNDEKALAWAKEHDVKFPVVKPNGGNPLGLNTRGIPHLFIVKADGTLVEDGHPMKLFTDEKLRELKSERGVSDMTYSDNGGCTWSYTDNNNEGSLTITGVRLQTPSPVTIPTSLNGKNVTRIGTDAFRGNVMITGVTIPGCIVGIGDRAFVGCTNLEELTILEGVKAIGGSDAFRGCPKLKSVTFPQSLTFIRQRAFKDMPDESMKVNVDSLEHWLSIGFGTGGSNPLCKGKSYLCVKGVPVIDLKIPEGTKELRSRAFFGYSALKSISIPGSVQRIGALAFANMNGARISRILFASNIGTVEIAGNAFLGSSPDCRIEVAPKPGCVFAGWEDEHGNLVDDILNQKQRIVITPRWNTEGAFSLNAAPGSITGLNLGNVPPLKFVYCPAGKFSMGYKEQPALSKVKDVEITSPFWVSKTPIRADQLEWLGLNSITNAQTGDAVITDASIVVQRLSSVLKERFGKMLPPGYVFRLPTEAEFEYLQKSETKDKDAPTNIWGVERLYSGGIIALLDRAPAYGNGVDVVNKRNNTYLAKVNYDNQPDKDPVGWSDDPNWSVFRRGLGRNCDKLTTSQGGGYPNCFYFVVAPGVDKLNKFYWK